MSLEKEKENGKANSLNMNIFRDTPLRYLGYANEVGESFRYQLPKLVVPSYVLAFGYCAADALSAGFNVYYERKKCSSGGSTSPNVLSSKPVIDGKINSLLEPDQSAALIATCDTLLWQCLASVMIPGATINAVVRVTRFVTASRVGRSLPASISKWIPTATGLSSIPFIIHPIDKAVDLLLDNTTRKWIDSEEIKTC